MSGSMNNVSIVEGDPSLNRSGKVHALRTPTTGESQAVSETLSLSEFEHCFFCFFLFSMLGLPIFINEKIQKGKYRDCRKSTGNKLGYWCA